LARKRPLILHVIDKLGAGGAERSLLNFCRRVDRDRFDIRLCLLRRPTAFSEQLQGIGIPVRCLSLSRWSPMQLAAIGRVVNSIKPDLLHLHLAVSSAVGNMVAAVTHTPMVCTDVSADWLKKSQPFLSRIIPHLRIDLAERFAKIIAVSSHVRRRIVDNVRVPANKVVVIPNGVEAEEFANVPLSPFFERCTIGPEVPIIGTVGRMVPEKGHKFLVQAAALLIAKHPDLRLVIVGDGPLRLAIANQAFALRIGSHVMLAGRRKDVSGFLGRFDVFVLPSIDDDMPLVLLEAMAARRPIVATRVGSIPEVVRHGATGLLVPPAAPQALADAIEKLLTDRRCANQVATMAQRVVREDYSAEEMTRSIEAVYAEVLEGRSGGKK